MVVEQSVQGKMSVQTEDTGKIFEMAVCVTFDTPFEGPYKYSMDEAKKLAARLQKVKELFPACRHTATKGARYDFTAVGDETKHLSAKTAKRGVGKVAPQVVGQAQPATFCERMEITYTTNSALKQHIQEHIVDILPTLVGYTFDCPNLYYHQKHDTIRYITMNTPIDWSKYSFKWTRGWTDWKNSSTLKVVDGQGKATSLLEIQFHTTRSNMAIRWCYENFLTVFKENLSIIDI